MNKKERALVLIAANGTTIVLMINQIRELSSLHAPRAIAWTLVASSLGALLGYLALSHASDTQRRLPFTLFEFASAFLFVGSLLVFVISVVNETFLGGRFTIH